MNEEQTRKDVFMIKKYVKDGEERSTWVKIGNAYVNRDGSLNVLLDAFPIDGKLQIRNPNI